MFKICPFYESHLTLYNSRLYILIRVGCWILSKIRFSFSRNFLDADDPRETRNILDFKMSFLTIGRERRVMSMPIRRKLGRGYCRQMPGRTDSSHAATNKSLASARAWVQKSSGTGLQFLQRGNCLEHSFST